MRIVLRQRFPLGRFHATPWKVNPFDDPFGEWPPSPWRLVRAVVARWYQWSREVGRDDRDDEPDALVRALCNSSFRFHVPVQARRGNPLRQYQPVEFGWKPPDKKKASTRSYGTSLVQDNYWSVPAEDSTLWWFIEGDQWNTKLVEVFDAAIQRIVYFGRAETFTEICRTDERPPQPNCELLAVRTVASVPVLVPELNACRADIERTTADPVVAGRSLPPGARIMFANLPRRPSGREESKLPPTLGDIRLMQFAIGWNVPPELRSIVRMTARFRSAVLRELYRIKTDGRALSWTALDESVRGEISDMLGKDQAGQPLEGHRHAEFLAWCESGKPTRVLVWRESRPFDADEQHAILRAASKHLSWATSRSGADEWKVRLVPLDRGVPLPPGFDGKGVQVWRSLTPYVPPRHHLRGGKPRDSESLVRQIRRELGDRGIPGADLVDIREVGDTEWVAVHLPFKETKGRVFTGDRRGYWLQLVFPEPITGPLRLGRSASFGLGLFAPANE